MRSLRLIAQEIGYTHDATDGNKLAMGCFSGATFIKIHNLGSDGHLFAFFSGEKLLHKTYIGSPTCELIYDENCMRTKQKSSSFDRRSKTNK